MFKLNTTFVVVLAILFGMALFSVGCGGADEQDGGTTQDSLMLDTLLVDTVPADTMAPPNTMVQCTTIIQNGTIRMTGPGQSSKINLKVYRVIVTVPSELVQNNVIQPNAPVNVMSTMPNSPKMGPGITDQPVTVEPIGDLLRR